MRRQKVSGIVESQLPQSGSRPYDWTGFLLHQAHRIAADEYAAELSRLELRPLHVGVLQLLRGESQWVQARLARELSVDKATVTAAVTVLEQRGYLQRVLHPDDERAYLVSITPAGVAALDRAEKLSQELSDRLFEVFSPQERESFHALLAIFCERHRRSRSM